jgi:serine/threonine protein kinase
MSQLVEAIIYQQYKGIMHRDLKPANLLIVEHMNVKVCDFGLACAMKDESEKHLYCGTPGYFAPEGLRKKTKIPPRRNMDLRSIYGPWES